MHPLVSSWLFWACHVDGLGKMSANNLRNTQSSLISPPPVTAFVSSPFSSLPLLFLPFPFIHLFLQFVYACVCWDRVFLYSSGWPCKPLTSTPLLELQAHQHCIFSESRSRKVWTWRKDSVSVDWQAERLGYITLSLNACRHTVANWSTLPLPGRDLGYGTQYLFTLIFFSVQTRATESTLPSHS